MNRMIETLRKLNPQIKIFSCEGEEFSFYGAMVTAFDFSSFIEYVREAAAPSEGVDYNPSINHLEEHELAGRIRRQFYGEMPLQVGWCIGRNDRMNAMEWHKGSEIVVAATSLLLILGKVYDVRGDSYDSSRAVAFVVPPGKAVELYSTTLHFAPVNLEPEGFRAIIILPQGTNVQLEDGQERDPLLFARNKWLLAHPEGPPAKSGAHCGITGKNIRITVR